ncbi:glutaredoxin 2 [Thiotrichales bacterium 19S3-7]|nr:glutaredoxin 2 [Thiotrichales bacterium 19S3-7]MCF6801729.1 glutaredoxin 2 [Thiotrichales bacterium 19S3-11]
MKLFQYEHCPYCVRPRLVAAAKNSNLDIVDLAYDDVQTPVSMIGAKMVPILQKNDLTYMAESLDICAYLDALDDLCMIKPKKADKQLDQVIEKLNYYIRYLAYPRLYYHPQNKAAFPTQSAIDAFKGPKQLKMGIDFDDALRHSDRYISATEALLSKAQAFFHQRLSDGVNQINDGFTLTYDDIEFFPVLRLLTIALDVIKIPQPIMQYLEKLSALSHVQLYTPFDYG